MINVFIGSDPRATVAFNMVAYSIHARAASEPVSTAALMLFQLKGVLTRERHPLQIW